MDAEKNNQVSIGFSLVKQLRGFFLSLVLIVLVYGLLVHYSIRTQESYTDKISLASRQRALAVELARDVVDFQNGNSSSENDGRLKGLRSQISKWDGGQKAITNGDMLYGTNRDNSAEVNNILQSITPVFVRCRDRMEMLLNEREPLEGEKFSGLLRDVDDYSEMMGRVVGVYIQESNKLYQRTVFINWFLLGVGLVSLLFGWRWVKKRMRNSFESSDSLLVEKDLQLEESENTKADFLSNISHELRIPLSGVLGMTEILSKTELDHEQRSYVRNIQSGAMNLLDIVSDILDYSDLQLGKLKLNKNRFVLAECIDQTMDLMKPVASLKHLELMSEINSDVPMELVQDERRLRQVLLGLLNNAIKYTDSGEVSIHAEVVNREGDFVQIKFAVKDTGIGVAEENFDKLFNSFYKVDSTIKSERDGSSGLNLTIVKSLVQEMGGRIWVESIQGQGSSFYFTIVAETSGVDHQKKIQALNGLKAVVIDDNITHLKIIVKQLSAWGIQATPFNSADLAVGIMSNLHKFDFLIMDMQMPEMESSQLAEQIRKKYPYDTLPIIALSTVGNHLLMDKGHLYNTHLTKPVKQARLLDVIVEVMEESPVHKAKKKLSRGNSSITSLKSNLRILVAQDNELSKAVTAKTLELLGHTFESVRNPLEVIERTKSSDFDLILMDVRMKDVDGIEMAKRVKKLTHKNEIVPVIFGLSEDEQDSKYCSQESIDDLVSKPMSPEVLQQKIEHWLNLD